eukprot:TRINITY_DN25289_c0_g1_i2.p1 TRINITY_DN25289_c0_g1~~TRINITY_DN25289_c0_g1_i2.p1  ORF type:complete len:396 (-),score=68.62 TRINITY_DN25289_c0_g1_i2:289-1476(-)
MWAMVLMNGALTLPGHCHGMPMARRFASLLTPADLADAQGSMLQAVLGLAAASVAFAGCENEAADEIAIETRASHLTRHRMHVANALVETDSLLLLVREASKRGFYAELAAFLSAVLQPELSHQVVHWAASVEGGADIVTRAVDASAALIQRLADCEEELWAGFLAAIIEGWAPGFLSDCGRIVLAVPVTEALGKQVLRCAMRTSQAQEATCLSALVVFAANAGIAPDAVPGFAVGMDEALRPEVARRLVDWKGTLRREGLGSWLSLLSPTLSAGDYLSPGASGVDRACSVEAAGRLPASAASRSASNAEGLRELLVGAPSELRCALDGRLLVDPVRSPHGQVCERGVLAAYLARSGNVCPFTKLELRIADCRRMPELRQEAVQWMRSQRAGRAR